MKHLVYLSLGSNIGSRRELLQTSIQLIRERIGSVEAVSDFIETSPVGFVSDYMFLNGAVRLRTDLSPLALLEALQAIERELGREKKSHNGVHYDRSIDLDILMYDDMELDTPQLRIPHPRMAERDFVLIPLKQVLL